MTPAQMRLWATLQVWFAGTLLAGLLLFAATYPTLVDTGVIDHGIVKPERGAQRTTPTGTLPTEVTP